MAADLETLIHAAAKRGELTHISMIASWGKDKTVIFKAYIRDATHNGRSNCDDADPVKALLGALKESRANGKGEVAPADEES